MLVHKRLRKRLLLLLLLLLKTLLISELRILFHQLCLKILFVHFLLELHRYLSLLFMKNALSGLLAVILIVLDGANAATTTIIQITRLNVVVAAGLARLGNALAIFIQALLKVELGWL